MTDRDILVIDNSTYQVGDLSLFPVALDDDISLYQTENNTLAILSGRLSINHNTIYVNDNDLFPDEGIIRINDEQIYYRQKEDKAFMDLIRGFNGSRTMIHNSGALVLGCVSSLHHNSVRDSIIQCQAKTGLRSDIPDTDGTLTSRLKYLDIKWFTPTARFTCQPFRGYAPLTVSFKNYSLGDSYLSYFWDFGDQWNESYSIEKNPIYTYKKPGIYSVTLTIKSADGRSANLTKRDYINSLSQENVYNILFFARNPISQEAYNLDSTGRPKYDNRVPLTVELIDQTLGNIQTRIWNFGDGTTIEQSGKENTIQHTYERAGIYFPEIQVIDQNGIKEVRQLQRPIVVGLESSTSDLANKYTPSITRQEEISINIIENQSLIRPDINSEEFASDGQSTNTFKDSLII